MGDWLKSGRSLWYVTGNISPSEAEKIVEGAREAFGLQTVKLEDLADVRVVSL